MLMSPQHMAVIDWSAVMQCMLTSTSSGSKRTPAKPLPVHKHTQPEHQHANRPTELALPCLNQHAWHNASLDSGCWACACMWVLQSTLPVARVYKRAQLRVKLNSHKLLGPRIANRRPGQFEHVCVEDVALLLSHQHAPGVLQHCCDAVYANIRQQQQQEQERQQSCCQCGTNHNLRAPSTPCLTQHDRHNGSLASRYCQWACACKMQAQLRTGRSLGGRAPIDSDSGVVRARCNEACVLRVCALCPRSGSQMILQSSTAAGVGWGRC